MESDIVARLRKEGFITHMARLPRESKVLHDAANEIERLRAEVRERELQRDHSRYLYLREIAYGEAAMMRDEARMRGWVLDIPDTAPAEPMRDA